MTRFFEAGDKVKVDEARLEAHFKKIDVNGNGLINAAEVEQALAQQTTTGSPGTSDQGSEQMHAPQAGLQDLLAQLQTRTQLHLEAQLRLEASERKKQLDQLEEMLQANDRARKEQLDRLEGMLQGAVHDNASSTTTNRFTRQRKAHHPKVETVVVDY